MEVSIATESSTAESSNEGNSTQELGNTLQAKVQCGKCDTLTEPLYREGWLCKYHAPVLRKCVNSIKGCTYSDINSKCERHEWFYCPYSVECGICSEIINNTTLDAHYTQAHGDITHRVGTVCSISPARECKVLLLKWDLGKVVCQYYLNLHRTYFVLRVHTTLTSAQLYKYKCSVEISHPDTGQVLTCTPRVWYDKWQDWQVRLARADYSAYFQDDRVNVRINISKINDPSEFNL